MFFCYLGYGGLLFLFNSLKLLFFYQGKPSSTDEQLPVTIIVASYNEAAVLKSEIRNTLRINYPAELLKIIFVVDGSTDASVAMICEHPSIQLIHLPERVGKYAAINAALSMVHTPVVVFSDANAMLNEDCLLRMIPHYSNPKVGGVAGEKKIISPERFSAVGSAEGLYWKYESFMKKQDAAFFTVVGAAGELFSVRTALIPSFKENLILDDFVISVNVCLKGFIIAYEPGAFASESPSISLKEEEKRKIRISAGAYQAIGYLKEALNFIKHPLLAFQYLFRRLFRWTLCPLLLIVLILSNLMIVTGTLEHKFYFWFFCLQLLFYMMASGGWLFARKGKRTGIATIPFYFLFMNYCLVRGFITYLRGQQTVLWEKAVREAVQ